jgi:hypothetical protein
MLTVLGVDLAVRDTGLAVVTFSDDGAQFSVREAAVLRRGGELSARTALEYADRLLEYGADAQCTGIDWDPRDVFWGNRAAGGLKALMVGYMLHAYRARGASPICIRPQRIREMLQLKPTAPKEAVFRAFEAQFPAFWSHMTEEYPDSADIYDAAIIAYARRILWTNGQTPRPQG